MSKMYSKVFIKFLILGLSMVFVYHHTVAIPTKCALESTCTKNTTSADEVCVLDVESGCIRKFPSKCFLNIAACKLGKNYTDNNNIYCSMDTYLCEEGYERWTIFFGHEKE